MNSTPRLWIKRVMIISQLHPLQVIRDVQLRLGLNIVWGKSTHDGSMDLLAGHSVGKTLLCRLIRYGVGETSYASEDFERDVEQVLPGAYVGLEVMVEGRPWAVARPLCRVKPGGRGKNREPRPDYALADVSVEELLLAQQRLNFPDYQRALDGLCESFQPKGLQHSEERPFGWAEMLQWIARDQETRFQDLTFWRSRRSRTGTPVDADVGDLLMRCALGLVDADEARVAVQLRQTAKRLKEAKARNEAARKTMWSVVQQINLRYANLLPQQPSEAENENLLISASNVLRIRLEELQGDIEVLTAEYKGLDRAEIAAYDAWGPIEGRGKLLESQLSVQDDALQAPGGKLKDLEFLKNHLAQSGDQLCPYCTKYYEKNEQIQARLAEEDQLREADAACRIQVMDHRRERELEIRGELERLGPEREDRRREFEAARAAKTEKRAELDELTIEKRVVERELEDLERNLAGVRAALDNRAEPLSPIQIEDLVELSREVDALRETLNQIRETKAHQLDEIRSAFDRVVKGVLNEHFTGVIVLDHGQLRFGLETGRGQRGEAVETLTVLLADLCTLVLGIEETVSIPGLLIHDSPREADIQPNVYNKIFEYAERLSQATGNRTVPFQYVITTTTPPPENQVGTDRIVLELSAASDEQLLLGRRVPPRSATKLES